MLLSLRKNGRETPYLRRQHAGLSRFLFNFNIVLAPTRLKGWPLPVDQKLLHFRFCKLVIEVAIYRMGNRPDTKIPRKWERKWKMAPSPKWPKNGQKMAAEMENGQKNGQNPVLGAIFHFRGHF